MSCVDNRRFEVVQKGELPVRMRACEQQLEKNNKGVDMSMSAHRTGGNLGKILILGEQCHTRVLKPIFGFRDVVVQPIRDSSQGVRVYSFEMGV